MLPEFATPPISEVVLGIQFETPPTYSQILAGEVWSLFRSDYPRTQEQLPLDPQFELFGVLPEHRIDLNFMGARHDRFWFVADDGHELVQFQQDRLLHNWRKMNSTNAAYPRFERMLPKFETEMRALETYFKGLGETPHLAINQCEITYINQIPLPDEGSCEAEKWINIIQFRQGAPDELQITTRDAIVANGDKIGRLYVEAKVGVRPDRKRFLALQLTARGLPPQPNIDGALDFLRLGRELIVNKFAEVTTDSAHKAWGRTQ